MPRVVTAPPLVVDVATEKRFEVLLAGAHDVAAGPPPILRVPGPPVQLLRWLAEARGFLLHGSNRTDIEVFEPRAQTDAVQRGARAVFATRDGIWPMFFAIVDRSRRHVLRNGFWRDASGVRHYNFGVDSATLDGQHFVDGAVYVLPPDSFTPCLTEDGAETEEWLAPGPVVPAARVMVGPEDFPFLSDIGGVDASAPFAFADALRDLHRSSAHLEEPPGTRIYRLSDDTVPLARRLVANIPAMELNDVDVEIDQDAAGPRLRFTGDPQLLDRLVEWASLPP